MTEPSLDFLAKTDAQNIAVMVSGGRSSHYMAKRMLEDQFWNTKNLIFAFSNTGKEAEATLKFVDECDKRWNLNIVWVEAVVDDEIGVGTTFKRVTFETASRDGRPFEDVIRKYGISNVNFPHCTRELKQRPLNAYFRSIWGGDYVTALGMRFDEMRRVSQKPKTIYPMVGWGTTTQLVREFWNAAEFDLKLKDYEGNCDLCWKKSLRKKLTILSEKPEVADWWREMEVRYGSKVFENRQTHDGPCHFNRGDQSIDDLVVASQQAFTPVTDAYYIRSEEMDAESPCQCMRQLE